MFKNISSPRENMGYLEGKNLKKLHNSVKTSDDCSTKMNDTLLPRTLILL